MKLEIRKILVPVDFSECSREALEAALALAERVGASVEILHVWEPPHLVGPEFLIREPGEKGHPLRELAIGFAEKEMNAFLEQFPQREALPVHYVTGKPNRAIVERAAAEGFDAIVMGTHGRSGIPHMVLGSVAEKVVRTAGCPVLTVRQRQAATAAEDAPTTLP